MMKYDVVVYNTVSTAQYSCSTVQHSTVAVQYSTVQYSVQCHYAMMKYDVVVCGGEAEGGAGIRDFHFPPRHHSTATH